MIGLISLLKEIEGTPKAIFMAGPAGSGKSYISSKLVPSDFTTINVDDTYEELLKSSGIGMKLAQMSPDELKKAGELMGQARKTTDTKYQDALKNAITQRQSSLYCMSRKWVSPRNPFSAIASQEKTR